MVVSFLTKGGEQLNLTKISYEELVEEYKARFILHNKYVGYLGHLPIESELVKRLFKGDNYKEINNTIVSYREQAIK